MPNLVPPVTTTERVGTDRGDELRSCRYWVREVRLLTPHLPSSDQALEYRAEVLAALEAGGRSLRDAPFTPLMTLYLTDRMEPEEVG